MSEQDRRNELIAGLEELLGPERTATLMGHLHPERWSELATKADLERFATTADLARIGGEVHHLDASIELRFEAQTAHLEAFVRERLDQHSRLLFLSMLGAILTTAAVVVGAISV